MLSERDRPRERLDLVATNHEPPAFAVHVAQLCLGHYDPFQAVRYAIVCAHRRRSFLALTLGHERR